MARHDNRPAWRWAMLAVAWLWGGSAQPLPAQAPGEPPPEERELECKGTILGVEGNIVGIETDKEKLRWLLQVSRDAEILVKGSAEPSYLHAGLVVRFVAEIDEKGNLAAPLKELEIYQPEGKAALGLFSKSAGEEDRPEKKPGAGTYQVRGKVRSIKERQLEVAAGAKKVSGTLAEGCKITIRSHDLSLAQEADKVEATGWFTDATRPDPAKQKPGRAVIHKRITVVLTNPLEGTKKRQPLQRTAASRESP